MDEGHAHKGTDDRMEIDERLQAEIRANVASALREDVGDGDLTSDVVAADTKVSAIIVTHDRMTMSGRPWVDEVYHQLDPQVVLDWLVDDGETVEADNDVCRLRGPCRPILSGERVALNFLQTLSATATVTADYVRAVAGTGCRILDTRKTLPGLRLAQKYAVRCGGGYNHRHGLFDAILIKDNHVASAGGIGPAIAAARERHPKTQTEIEVESITEVREALAAHPDRLLLDNFSLEMLKEAVAINRAEGDPPVELEASGGMTIERISDVAKAGVDYVSVGALTKNVRAIDLSMRIHGLSRNRG